MENIRVINKDTKENPWIGKNWLGKIKENIDLDILFDDFKAGAIIKVKTGSKVWCITIQDAIVFPEEKYVRLDAYSTCFGGYTIFGTVIEPNMYGPLEKYEVEFPRDCVDPTEHYDDVEVFNRTKKPFMWMDFTTSFGDTGPTLVDAKNQEDEQL